MDARLERYVAAVAACAQHLQLDVLILSGGHTGGPDRPSEAALLASMLTPRLDGVRVLLEEAAYTTLHNLLYTKQMLARLGLEPPSLVIFCDYVRRPKVWLLSKILFPMRRVRIEAIARKEPIATYLIQIPSTLIQVAGALSPRIAAWLDTRRRTRVG